VDPLALDEPRLRRLIEVGRGLVSRLDLEGVLETVLEAAREITGARYAALGILDERKRELERFVTLGIDEETHAAIGDLPRGRGVLGELIAHPEPLRLADVTAHPRSYGFPSAHPEMHTFLGVPIAIRGEAWGNLYLTEKSDGREFDEHDETAATVLADWTAIAVENARLYEGLARRRDEVEAQRDDAEQSLRALMAMTEIAQVVGGETRLDRILELIAKRGRALLSTRGLAILLADGGELEVAAMAGELDPALAGRRIPIDGTSPGRVLTGGAERLPASYGETADLSELGVEADAAVLVPLTFRGRGYGVLAAFDRLADGPGFSQEDERLLRAFAASAATAVATAKSVESETLRRSLEAAEGERKRWARELHDQTLQALGGLRMLHSTALRADDAAKLRDALEQSVALIDEEIESLSGLITELRPAALDEIGLEPALRNLAERKRHDGAFEVEVTVRLDGGDGARLPADAESTIYRLTQEALNNAVKHAEADRVEATVHQRDTVVELTVRDDGRGFDPELTTRGFGLLGMRERVGLVSGELRIESAPGRGTVVSATIPLDPADG
jgi:signal transduction histidine kinase